MSFNSAMSAAAERVAPNDIEDIGTSLAHQIGVVQFGADALTAEALHSGPKDWLRLVFFVEGFYHQLYDAITTASVLLGQRTSPPLRVTSLAKLREQLKDQPHHPLNNLTEAQHRSLDLLGWFCKVRSALTTHRAERGHTANRGVVSPDSLAVWRTKEPLPPGRLDAALDLYPKMANKHHWAWQSTHDRQVLNYLDLGSHLIFAQRPKDFALCREAVEAAKAYDLVVSAAVLHNADSALAELVRLVPT